MPAWNNNARLEVLTFRATLFAYTHVNAGDPIALSAGNGGSETVNGILEKDTGANALARYTGRAARVTGIASHLEFSFRSGGGPNTPSADLPGNRQSLALTWTTLQGNIFDCMDGLSPTASQNKILVVSCGPEAPYMPLSYEGPNDQFNLGMMVRLANIRTGPDAGNFWPIHAAAEFLANFYMYVTVALT